MTKGEGERGKWQGLALRAGLGRMANGRRTAGRGRRRMCLRLAHCCMCMMYQQQGLAACRCHLFPPPRLEINSIALMLCLLCLPRALRSHRDLLGPQLLARTEHPARLPESEQRAAYGLPKRRTGVDCPGLCRLRLGLRRSPSLLAAHSVPVLRRVHQRAGTGSKGCFLCVLSGAALQALRGNSHPPASQPATQVGDFGLSRVVRGEAAVAPTDLGTVTHMVRVACHAATCNCALHAVPAVGARPIPSKLNHMHQPSQQRQPSASCLLRHYCFLSQALPCAAAPQAPELLRAGKLSPAADCYAFDVILCEVSCALFAMPDHVHWMHAGETDAFWGTKRESGPLAAPQ